MSNAIGNTDTVKVDDIGADGTGSGRLVPVREVVRRGRGIEKILKVLREAESGDYVMHLSPREEDEKWRTACGAAGRSSPDTEQTSCRRCVASHRYARAVEWERSCIQKLQKRKHPPKGMTKDEVIKEVTSWFEHHSGRVDRVERALAAQRDFARRKSKSQS